MLIPDLQRAIDRAREGVDAIEELGRARAEAERDYRVALRKAVLGLRARGMPASVASDAARGQEEVARLAFERDCAQAVYDASYEALLLAKKEAGLIEAQVEREWRG